MDSGVSTLWGLGGGKGGMTSSWMSGYYQSTLLKVSEVAGASYSFSLKGRTTWVSFA
jgi:hypothetical protein